LIWKQGQAGFPNLFIGATADKLNEEVAAHGRHSNMVSQFVYGLLFNAIHMAEI